jgi:maltose alpha-D-glucosyltransferase/alpha-amylase
MLDSLPGLLPAFLVRQRWFGGKAKTIVSCEVEDSAELPDADAETVAVIAGVSYSDGLRERYVLLLSSRTDAGGFPSVGRVALPGGDWIVEAATDAASAPALLRGFTRGGSIPTRRGGILQYGDTGAAARHVLASDPRVEALGNEQSNTSLRVGSLLVFKLFRRLQPGENPELEVGRFLTSRTTFAAMSALEGSLTYIAPDGESATLGVLQTWVDNEGDGWGYVLSALDEHRRAGMPPPRLAPEMIRLGAITADFHAALASDHSSEAFRPEPVQQHDIDAWCSQLLDRVSRVCALTETRLRTWPEDTRRLAAALLSKSQITRSIASAAGGAAASFQKIRIHGDYHLGQTLKTPSGFVIIDFEGEPATPMALRRQKHCALKDVAGMLRSFEYAIETSSDHGSDTADHLRRPPGLRERFLEGYLESAGAHELRSIPGDRAAVAQWLSFFELEKALYELEYEVNNRPSWAHIPLRGILRILDAHDA